MNIKRVLKKVSWLFIGLLFCLPVLATPIGSRLAQEKFNQQMFDLLKIEELEQVRALMQSVPDCPDSVEELGSKPAPTFCTRDRSDNLGFLRHIWKKNSLVGKVDFDVVSVDAGLYDSLGALYRAWYQSSNTQFDRDHYRHFYAKYKGTWLQPYVEQILTQLWQPGTEFRKEEGFSAQKGQEIYNTLYISHMLDFDSMYQYVSPEIRLDKSLVGGGRGMLRDVLRGLDARSAETGSPELLHVIKNNWLNSILSPEHGDEEESNYYGGKKLQRVFELLNEDGWAMFADPGMQPTHWQKHTVSIYVRACPRLHRADVCEAFEKGATKYGYYTAPIQRVELTPEEIIEEIRAGLREKLKGI